MKKKKRNGYFIVGLAMTVVTFLVTLVALFWTPYESSAMSSSQKFQPPSFAHWFGTDQFGRDLLSRVMEGIVTTVVICVLVVLLSAIVGVIVGAVTGYFGGILDELMMRITDAINGFPSILLALVLISLFESGIDKLILALAIAFCPSYIRIVRSEFIKYRDADFVARARLMGIGWGRIMFVHILPNIYSTFLVSIVIGFNNAILAESGMSFLGIGVLPPQASLGKMLSDAQGYLSSAPWYALAPGMAIVWIVLGFSLLGEGIRRQNQ